MKRPAEDRVAFQRDRYMPIRKAAIVDRLAATAAEGAERDDLLELARRLGLLFHVEYFSRREALKELYIPFNPDQPGNDALEVDGAGQDSFLDRLEETLLAANFSRLDAEELERAEKMSVRVRAQIRVPKDVFRAVRFYGRGRGLRPVTVRTWFGLRTEEVQAVCYDNIVFVAVIRTDLDRKRSRRDPLRPGGVYLKLFRDIPREDLNTLYPNAKVVMGLRDKLILGVPALVGGIPILINLLPALTVLFAVVGFYLGIVGAVEDDKMKQAIAALSGLAALGGFLMRQWVKYERQSLKYAKQVADNVYFNNINNNSGFFDYIVGASEDSEVKEALLAWTFLARSPHPLTLDELDRQIEAWLTAEFDVDVDFDEEDALAKLRRLGLVEETSDGRLSAVPIALALKRTSDAWIGFAHGEGPMAAAAEAGIEALTET